MSLLTTSILLAAANVRAQGEIMTLSLSETSSPADTPAQASGTMLPQLVEEALAHNLKIRIDEAQIAEARALYELAAAQAYPRFMANAIFGGPTPEQKTRVKNDIGTVTDASLEGDFDFGELGVTFRFHADGAFPIYSFGKISTAKEAAGHFVRAAQHKTVATQAEVVMSVHRAFWAFQLTRAFVESLSDGEKTLERVLSKIEELLDSESPQVTENDRLRLLHALATVRVKSSEAQNARELARSALKLLLGRDQSTDLELAYVDLDELPSEIPDLGAAVLSAKERRPEIRALRAVVDAQMKFAEFRRKQFWPDFFLGGVLKYALTSNATNQTNPFLFDDANVFEAGLGIGIRLELDVFNKMAILEQAEAAALTRTAEANAAEQAIDLEVRKIHRDIENGYERIKLLDRANRAARGWLTASALAYDIGTGDAAELIDSFLAWAASEGELQKTRYDMHLAHADLSRAAGRLVSPGGGESRGEREGE